tara:strand:+ start:1275 stop:1469 length:195 start_codon:yes stop_codon:yes gene_type:complete
MEELIDRLNGSELIIKQHETRDDKVKEFLFLLGEVLSETDQLASSVLRRVETEYINILNTLEGI